jgi:hypothetical protein
MGEQILPVLEAHAVSPQAAPKRVLQLVHAHLLEISPDASPFQPNVGMRVIGVPLPVKTRVGHTSPCFHRTFSECPEHLSKLKDGPPSFFMAAGNAAAYVANRQKMEISNERFDYVRIVLPAVDLPPINVAGAQRISTGAMPD